MAPGVEGSSPFAHPTLPPGIQRADDVASGTEASPGRKDPAKLTAIVRAVEEADARLGALA